MLNISHHNMITAANIQNKIIEPFELFAENFEETNNNLYKNGNKVSIHTFRYLLRGYFIIFRY